MSSPLDGLHDDIMIDPVFAPYRAITARAGIRAVQSKSSEAARRLLAESWARRLHEAEGEAKVLRRVDEPANEIASRYAKSPIEEAGSQVRRHAHRAAPA